MTAVSSAQVCAASPSSGWSCSRLPMARAPGTPESVVKGSAVSTKKCSQSSLRSKASKPSLPIGNSALPWKQRKARACESCRW